MNLLVSLAQAIQLFLVWSGLHLGRVDAEPRELGVEPGVEPESAAARAPADLCSRKLL